MKFDARLMDVVRKDLDNNLIPMLLGEPGIGKSSWVEGLGTLMHTKVFVMACNQLADKADLTGARLVPTDDGKDYRQVFYPHITIHDAIEYAKANTRETPILFLDELNRTTPDVTSAALSIPTARSIGSKKLPPNLRIIIAGNDKGNVTSLDEASVSRFVLYPVRPDVSTFLSLDPELNIFIKNVLHAHPECIFCKSIAMSNSSDDDDDDNNMSIEDIIGDTDEMSQITTPRTLSGTSRWLNSFTSKELIEALADTYVQDGAEISFLQEALEGHLGKTVFTTYLLAEIANNVMSVNNQSAALTIGKPQCYDEMKSCPDMQSLGDFVNTMSENDKSGALLYAMYEQTDNNLFIKTLAPNIERLMQDDMKTLMNLSASDQLDSENVRILLETKSNISNALSIILETV